MRFSQLSIQTQRTVPADIRNPGLALLFRAGYFSRTTEPLPLARAAMQRLQQAFSALPNGSEQEFFTSLGLHALKDSETGEFLIPLETGSDEMLHCGECGYAARRELARAGHQPFDQEEALPLEKIATPESNTIAQLAAFMRIPQEKTAKALMFTRFSDGKFIFVVIRGDMQLSEAKLSARVGAVRMATPDEIIAAGAVPGYASPIGLRSALVLVDALVAASPNLVAGANEHGYHYINTNHGRDYQADLQLDLTLNQPGAPCPQCSAPLLAKNAVMVLSKHEILFENLFSVLAEVFHDDKGLTFPAQVAPFAVYLMNVPGKTLDTKQAAEEIYTTLSDAGVSVLFDDRDERAGIKFNDADLIGCPVRVTVGERGLQNAMVELKPRIESDIRLTPLDELVEKIKALL